MKTIRKQHKTSTTISTKEYAQTLIIIKKHVQEARVKATLPAPDSDMAKQSLKDPYLFDFLALRDDYLEQELEQGPCELTNYSKKLMEKFLITPGN